MIRTGRLHLRPLVEGDREWLRAQSASPEVMEHLGGPQPAEACDARMDYMMQLQAERGFSFWLVEPADPGISGPTRMGICGLKLFDAPNATLPAEYEIGWRFDPPFWGQGYAREAAEAALAHAFDVLRAERVVALTTIGNTASWGLMERLGMTRRPDLDFSDPRYEPPEDWTIVYLIERPTGVETA